MLSVAQLIMGSVKKEICNTFSHPDNQLRDLQIRHDESSSCMEIRMNDATLTCYFDNPGSVCRKNFLFPDNDKDIYKYVMACNKKYKSLSPNRWLNTEDKVMIEIFSDEGLAIGFTQLPESYITH